MASIDVGSSGRGKKALDSELPLVPFIDLLLCCVMFLLVTAVWNQLAALSPAESGTSSEEIAPPSDETPFLRVRVTRSGFAVEDALGAVENVPRVDSGLDLSRLLVALERRDFGGARPTVLLTPDDDTSHGEVIMTLDRLVGGGFADVHITSVGGAFGAPSG